jgi:hypothetical protein
MRVVFFVSLAVTIVSLIAMAWPPPRETVDRTIVHSALKFPREGWFQLSADVAGGGVVTSHGCIGDSKAWYDGLYFIGINAVPRDGEPWPKETTIRIRISHDAQRPAWLGATPFADERCDDGKWSHAGSEGPPLSTRARGL